MLGAAALSTLLALAAASDRSLILEPDLQLRLVSGSEWDTNAQRAVARGDRDIVSDGLVRLLVDTHAQLAITGDDHLRASYTLGAKRFFREQGEDVVAHDLRLGTTHRLAGPLGLHADGRFRASRMRNGLRDYTLVNGGAGPLLELGDFVLSAYAHYERFGYGITDTLDYQGPVTGAELSWRGTKKLSITGFAAHAWRGFEVNARQDVSTEEQLKVDTCDGPARDPLCEDPYRRKDRELGAGVRALYQGSFLLGGEISARFQDSNDALERIDRYRLSIFATIPLPLELLLSFLGGLQFHRGLSATQASNLVEDDENQNSLEVQLGRKITAALSVNARYALYANSFATNDDTRFFRQTFYLGLSYELDRGGAAELP